MQQTIAGSGFQKKSIEINKQLEFSDNLTETEKSVLDILLEYSKQSAPTSIDQINRALGVKNKEVTIQNKLRSDTLQMINKKFMVFASTSDTLVEREKTALDKRVYQYKINERYLNKIK
jgi:Mn-dependent DtxR family transcriptional regulator